MGIESGDEKEFTKPRTVYTLQRIVDSTRALLAERGYEAVSMRAVAERSDITAGAIYKHFPSKNALVEHVIADSLQEFELRLLRAIAPLPVGSFERIAALGTEYIRLGLEYEEHFKVLFTPQRPGPRKISELPGHGGYDVLRQCVVEAIESGCIGDSDPDLVAFFLWSRVHGIVTLLWACDFRDVLPVKELSALSLFEATRDFVVNALSAEKHE